MASLSSPDRRRHHALAIPLPAQGHMNALMRLCQKLASEGFIITFVNIEPLHHLIEELHGAAADHEGDVSAPAHPIVQRGNIRRAYVPIDGLDLSNDFRFTFEHSFGCMKTLAPYLEQLLHRLRSTDPGSPDVPPVTCLISDFFLTDPCCKLARSFDLPWFVFYPQSATTFLHLDHIFHGDISQHDVVEAVEKGGTGVFCGSVQGLPPMNVEDLMSFKHMKTEHRFMYELMRKQMEETRKSGHAQLVFNSFREAEEDALKALEERMKLPMYAVGPLIEEPQGEGHAASASATSLWKEDGGCMDWLNLQPPRSVLYISFGSVTVLSRLQFEELVAGLLSSGHRFLFVFRPSLILEDDTCVEHGYSDRPSPEDLLRSSHDRAGYVAQWTPQLRVLSHPSVAVFLTHCGWNSVLEAIAAGVPMLCWPYFSDQFMNAKLVVQIWKVGLALRSVSDGPIVSREEVKETLGAAMEVDGKSVNALRQNALWLQEACARSLSPGGTSRKSLQELIRSLPASSPPNG